VNGYKKARLIMTSVFDLFCEHLVNPLGIDNPQPRFSWKCRTESVKRFRLQIRDLWDTGLFQPNRMPVAYDGPPLKKQTVYYWRVGTEDDWSNWATFETGFFSLQDWEAHWVSYSWAHIAPENRSVNFIRKEFDISDPKAIVRARLYAAATAGYSGNDTLRMNLYQVCLNAEKVGVDLLNPGQLSWDRRRALYRTYDIQQLLKKGRNAVGMIFASNMIAFEILLEYQDGRIEHIHSGPTCRTNQRGPFQTLWKHDVYEYGGKGEVYDARNEFNGWDSSGFDDSNWKVVSSKGYEPEILAAQLQSVTVFETFNPKKTWKLPDGSNVADFGHNMNGYVHTAIYGGERGHCIKLSFSEAVGKDGIPDYQTTLSQMGHKSLHQDVYYKKGCDTEYFAPSFANHGFRYVQIEGYPKEMDGTEITANAVSSQVENRLELSTSDALLTNLFQLAKNSFRSNLMSVCTDCPSRERQAWSADAASISGALNLFFDMELFIEKWMRDIADSQHKNGAIPFIAPFPEPLAGPEIPWATGFLQVVCDTYLMNGDLKLIKDVHPVFQKWCQFLKYIAENDGLSRGCALYGDHMSTHAVDKVFLENIFAMRSFDLQKQISSWLGKTDEMDYWKHAADRKKRAIRRRFARSDGFYGSATVSESVLAVAFDLVEKEEKKQLLEAVEVELTANLNIPTGYLATRPLMEVIDRKLAWKLIQSPRQRTWRNWLENGLTTAPEYWDYQRGTLNHAALAGPMAEWLIRGLAGIIPLKPGGLEFKIDPFFPENLHDLAIVQTTPLGKLEWNWIVAEDKRHCHLKVPVGMVVFINNRTYGFGDYSFQM
jgi:alpha-L-rhamnosidase